MGEEEEKTTCIDTCGDSLPHEYCANNTLLQYKPLHDFIELHRFKCIVRSLRC